jgi:hypothetical protein
MLNGRPDAEFDSGVFRFQGFCQRWAEECQNVDLPSESSQVKSCTFAFSRIGRLASQTCPFTLAAKTFLANPSLMERAMSSPLVPAGNGFIVPSGRVISIDCIMFGYLICSFRLKQNGPMGAKIANNPHFTSIYRDRE